MTDERPEAKKLQNEESVKESKKSHDEEVPGSDRRRVPAGG